METTEAFTRSIKRILAQKPRAAIMEELHVSEELAAAAETTTRQHLEALQLLGIPVPVLTIKGRTTKLMPTHTLN